MPLSSSVNLRLLLTLQNIKNMKKLIYLIILLIATTSKIEAQLDYTTGIYYDSINKIHIDVSRISSISNITYHEKLPSGLYSLPSDYPYYKQGKYSFFITYYGGHIEKEYTFDNKTPYYTVIREWKRWKRHLYLKINED